MSKKNRIDTMEQELMAQRTSLMLHVTTALTGMYTTPVMQITDFASDKLPKNGIVVIYSRTLQPLALRYVLDTMSKKERTMLIKDLTPMIDDGRVLGFKVMDCYDAGVAVELSKIVIDLVGDMLPMNLPNYRLTLPQRPSIGRPRVTAAIETVGDFLTQGALPPQKAKGPAKNKALALPVPAQKVVTKKATAKKVSAASKAPVKGKKGSVAVRTTKKGAKQMNMFIEGTSPTTT